MTHYCVTECNHKLQYCSHCKKVYCTECAKVWAEEYLTSTTSFTGTGPSIYWADTDYGTVSDNCVTCH